MMMSSAEFANSLMTRCTIWRRPASLFWNNLEMPKKSVVASCLPQLSPVKSSRASLVKIWRYGQLNGALDSTVTIARPTTLHFRGEMGLALKTRATCPCQQVYPSCSFTASPLCVCVRVRACACASPYLLGTPMSCQSARRRRRPHASCPSVRCVCVRHPATLNPRYRSLSCCAQRGLSRRRAAQARAAVRMCVCGESPGGARRVRARSWERVRVRRWNWRRGG